MGACVRACVRACVCAFVCVRVHDNFFATTQKVVCFGVGAARRAEGGAADRARPWPWHFDGRYGPSSVSFPQVRGSLVVPLRRGRSVPRLLARSSVLGPVACWPVGWLVGWLVLVGCENGAH